MPVTSISGRKRPEEGGADRLIAYHEAFETLEEPEYAEAFSCVQALLDNAVGEAVRMKYYYDLLPHAPSLNRASASRCRNSRATCAKPAR